MFSILLLVVLFLMFLFAFGLAIYYFWQIEKKYKKKRVIHRLSSDQPIDETMNEKNSERKDSQTDLDISNARIQNKLREIESKEFAVLRVPDLKIKIKFSEIDMSSNPPSKLDNDETKLGSKNEDKIEPYKSSLGKEMAFRMKGLESPNYSEPAKLPSSFYSQKKISTIGKPSSNILESNGSLTMGIPLKRTETEEILFTPDGLPSATQTNLKNDLAFASFLNSKTP